MTPTLAGFWRRLSAAAIDGLIIFGINLVLGSITALINSNAVGIIANLLSLAISITYYVYFIGSRGQTPGKIALKIKVVRTDNVPMTYMTAFLREVVGKFLSGLIFAMGYFWMIWDKNKQTWHDHLAKTQVVRV